MRVRAAKKELVMRKLDERIMKEEGVALVPGGAFGDDRWVRLSFAVSDAELERAVSFAFQRLKLVVEPGGAAALAVLLSGRFDAKSRTIAIVLTGGNCDIATVAACCAAAGDP